MAAEMATVSQAETAPGSRLSRSRRSQSASRAADDRKAAGAGIARGGEVGVVRRVIDVLEFVAAVVAVVVLGVVLWVGAIVARAAWGAVVDEQGRYPWEH